MPQVDTARFLADLNELRKIGAFRTGVHRPTYSPQDMESRRWRIYLISARAYGTTLPLISPTTL